MPVQMTTTVYSKNPFLSIMITFQKWPKSDSKLHLVDHEVESATPKLATKGSSAKKI